MASRIALYAVAAGATVALLGVTLSFLGFVALSGMLSLLIAGNVGAVVPLAIGGVGLLILGSVGAFFATTVRRIDRFVQQAAQLPDPLDEARSKYVAGDIDETELERQLERVLVKSDNLSASSGRRSSPTHDPKERSSLTAERAAETA